MTKSSREEKKIRQWERDRPKWYNIYFAAGIALALLIALAKPFGFNLGGSLYWGSLYTIGIALSTMFVGTILHERAMGL